MRRDVVDVEEIREEGTGKREIRTGKHRGKGDDNFDYTEECLKFETICLSEV